MIEFKLGNLSIKISEEVFEKMKSFIQDENHKPEAGGILIGYYLEDNNYSIIDSSSPSRFDKSSRYNFTRSKKNSQKIINKNFKDSKGKKIYLGEWHTHPEDYPTPSCLDKKSILEQIRGNILNSKIIFMLILGRKGIYISYADKNEIKAFKNINFINL
ncbi:Mov34/MPN/PAD-1 family protein [Confluentibacter lentus]|uniref:Mov34/MPN/PAD-1 family protein n=1 Tax=Confluentibacter lentus TaxID=1699412 RepID=UPI000C2836EE|nr:Mov34/MPN/PAD-1 family protein [Confluentibacter lentus]